MVTVAVTDPRSQDARHCLWAYATELATRLAGALAEAINLYRSSGFTEVPAFNDEPYADHSFEKALTA